MAIFLSRCYLSQIVGTILTLDDLGKCSTVQAIQAEEARNCPIVLFLLLKVFCILMMVRWKDVLLVKLCYNNVNLDHVHCLSFLIQLCLF